MNVLQKQAKKGRPQVYDWDKLIKESLEEGIEHDFVEGVDFTCVPSSFGNLTRRTARTRRLNVIVSVDGGRVYFCFVRPN
jgi:hypothetical protein